MHKYKQAEVAEGTDTQIIQTHHGGLMPELIPQVEYCKSQVMCQESGRSDWASGLRTGDYTHQDSETTKRSRGEQGDSGILKRGRQGQATLSISLDTTGTGCCDYQSELSDSVLEGEEGTHRETSHSSCHGSISTTPRDYLGWDTHDTNK